MTPTTKPTQRIRQSRRPILIDACCGAGGAAMGFWQAGFQPVGFDNSPQRLLRYPFPKFKADITQLEADELVALCLRALGAGGRRVVVVGHASPPCPSYSVTRHAARRADHRPPPDRLISLVRMLLQEAQQAGLLGAYVIENVEDAKHAMRNPVRLCGSSHPFRLRVRRHRLFRGQCEHTAKRHAL